MVFVLCEPPCRPKAQVAEVLLKSGLMEAKGGLERGHRTVPSLEVITPAFCRDLEIDKVRLPAG